MNTFKTTACLLSLVTAGFAIEDRTPQRTPVRLGNTFAEVATPVQDFAALNIGSPVHHLAPQQLFPVTPQDGGQPNMFVTPQGQAVENQAPNAPGRRARRVVMHTPGSNLDYLASTINSVASPEIRKRSNFGDVTIFDSKGRTVLTTAKKKKGESSSLVQECGSPTGVEEALSIFDRLETSGRTPFAPMFTERKIVGSEGWYDPVRLDHNNSYLSVQEESVDEGNQENILGGSDVQNTSVGSFAIRGANLLGVNCMDNSMTDDSSFVIHGADLLNASVVSEVEDDDALSEIGDENSVVGDFSDIDARYPNDYFSDEE